MSDASHRCAHLPVIDGRSGGSLSTSSPFISSSHVADDAVHDRVEAGIGWATPALSLRRTHTGTPCMVGCCKTDGSDDERRYLWEATAAAAAGGGAPGRFRCPG